MAYTKYIDSNDPNLKDITKLGQSGEQLQQDYLDSLTTQTKQYEDMPGKIQQAFEVGKSNLQSQAAQALAQSKAVRGGRGLAVGTSSAIQSGKAIAANQAESNIAQGQALQEAAKAKTSLIVEQKKMNESQALKKAQVEEAKGIVKQIIDDESGTFVTSKEDVARMKTRFQNEVYTKYKDNPQALQAAIAEFNNALGSNETTQLLPSAFSSY